MAVNGEDVKCLSLRPLAAAIQRVAVYETKLVRPQECMPRLDRTLQSDRLAFLDLACYLASWLQWGASNKLYGRLKFTATSFVEG